MNGMAILLKQLGFNVEEMQQMGEAVSKNVKDIADRLQGIENRLTAIETNQQTAREARLALTT
jgi:hypothetical protein